MSLLLGYVVTPDNQANSARLIQLSTIQAQGKVIMPPAPWSKTGMISNVRNFSWTVDQNAGSKLYEESFAKYNLDRQTLLTLLQEWFPKHKFKDGEPIVGLLTR